MKLQKNILKKRTTNQKRYVTFASRTVMGYIYIKLESTRHNKLSQPSLNTSYIWKMIF